jgi:hypothetical protein
MAMVKDSIAGASLEHSRTASLEHRWSIAGAFVAM